MPLEHPKKANVPSLARDDRRAVTGTHSPAERSRWTARTARIAKPLNSIPANLTKFIHQVPLGEVIAFEGRLKRQLLVRADDRIELYKNQAGTDYFAVVKSGLFTDKGKVFHITNPEYIKALRYLETGEN